MDLLEKRLKESALFESEWMLIFEIPNTFYKIACFYGVTIEMHTNESNHYGTPHCHAKYQDKSISISLRDFSILETDGMDSKHQKMAVEYVKNHVDYLKERWNKNPNVIKF